MTYEDEEIINYEVELKASLLDNSMQVTTALYYQDWSNIRNGANVNFDPTDFGGTDINNADYSPGAQGNGGDNRLIGWDSSINWQMTDSFSLNTTLSFHDTTATDFCNVGATGFGLENNRFPGIDGVDVTMFLTVPLAMADSM